MKKRIWILMAAALMLAACSPAETKPTTPATEQTTEQPKPPETVDIDNEKAETWAKATLDLLNAKDTEGLKATFDENMKTALSDETLQKVMKDIEELGTFKEIKDIRSAGMKGDSGKIYSVVAIDAVYSEREVSYSLSYDEDGKLAGMYMQ